MASTRCRWPWKHVHRSEEAAAEERAAMLRDGMDVRKLYPYPCPAGHWHLGHPPKGKNPVRVARGKR